MEDAPGGSGGSPDKTLFRAIALKDRIHPIQKNRNISAGLRPNHFLYLLYRYKQGIS